MHTNILAGQTVYLANYRVTEAIDSMGGSLYTAQLKIKRDKSGT